MSSSHNFGSVTRRKFKVVTIDLVIHFGRSMKTLGKKWNSSETKVDMIIEG